MTTERLFTEQNAGLTRRIQRMVGSRESAEDVVQDAFLRMWRSAPPGMAPAQQVAWLNRTATNLALDELRRRSHRDHDELEESAVEALSADGAEAVAVRDALERISAHERLLVLLRFQAGLTYEEVAELVAITPEAARKRVGRARAAFTAAYRGASASDRPLILLQTRDDADAYVGWLTEAGADVRRVRPGPIEAQIAMADGLVICGSVIDVHPSLYGQTPRVPLNTPDLEKDLRELSITRAALEASLPLVGICKGSQLMNIALGGSLYQDINSDGATRRSHWRVQHSLETRPGTLARRILGRRGTVSSEHHQAADRLGRGVFGTARSDDSIFETIELRGGRFALGTQWHPEHQESGVTGRRVADALVEAAR